MTELFKSNDFPEEIVEQFNDFIEALKKARDVLEPLMRINVNSPELDLSPLDRARLNLTCGYAMNSLFWMYMTTLGIDPKNSGMTSEMERYKEYMLKVERLSKKKSDAPRIDKAAAGRFIKGALWEPKQHTEEECTEAESTKRSAERHDNSFRKKKRL